MKTTVNPAELRAWNRANERARAEYRQNPLVTHRAANTSDGRSFRYCRNDCGQTTRARDQYCLACRKGER